VTGKDATRLEVIGNCAKVIEKPVFTASQVNEVIKELFALTVELQEVWVDTT